METIARDYRTGRWIRVTAQSSRIERVESADGPREIGPVDLWIAPAFWDIQFNGRWGVSFSDPSLTVDQVVEIVQAQIPLGAVHLCPTLITAPFASFEHGVRTIAAACERDAQVAARVFGIHLEGPYISPLGGYRGAHPRDAVRAPDWSEFEALQDASGNRIKLITLAPESPGAIEFIRRAVAAGVVVALGHTAADPETIRAAVDAGARLSTHLGNGIAATLPRHPNAIWAQAAEDRLWASLIADGHHVDPATLRVLVRAKTPERIILVSDASPLAGLPPGPHGEWEIDRSGKIVVAGTPYLAGSNQGLETGLNTLLAGDDVDLQAAIAMVTSHPAQLFGQRRPELGPGEEFSAVLFRYSNRRISLMGTYASGIYVSA